MQAFLYYQQYQNRCLGVHESRILALLPDEVPGSMDEFENEIDPEEREARDGNDDFDFIVGVLENGEVGVDEAQ